MSDTPVTPSDQELTPEELERTRLEELEADRELGDAAALEADTIAELEAMSPEELTELAGLAEPEGQAGAELTEDLGPAPLNPEPLPGFVRMHHPEINATADVSESAVHVHKARGWMLLEELPTEANTNTNTEAPASATEED